MYKSTKYQGEGEKGEKIATGIGHSRCHCHCDFLPLWRCWPTENSKSEKMGWENTSVDPPGNVAGQ
jgi:hypothetical protein